MQFLIWIRPATLTALGLVWLLSGCHSCFKDTPQANNAQQGSRAISGVILDPAALFAKLDQFTYRSELSLTLGQKGAVKTTRELIEVLGQKPLLLLTKNTNHIKSLAILARGDDFFVKDHNGPFHRAPDAKHLYNNIIYDGLNATSWIVTQFDIGNYIKNKSPGDNKISIKNSPLNQESPFIKNLANRFSPFSSLEKCTIQGTIGFDNTTGFLNRAHLEINVVGLDEHFVTMVLNVSLKDRLQEAVVMPEIINNEPINAPVNIVPRFKELMELEQGVK